MRLILYISLALALAAGPACAQSAGPVQMAPSAAQTPAQANANMNGGTVQITPSLAQSLYLHLTQGGTFAAGQRLAEDLQTEVMTPMREAQMRKMIESEVRASMGRPGATPPPSGGVITPQPPRLPSIDAAPPTTQVTPPAAPPPPPVVEHGVVTQPAPDTDGYPGQCCRPRPAPAAQ